MNNPAGVLDLLKRLREVMVTCLAPNHFSDDDIRELTLEIAQHGKPEQAESDHRVTPQTSIPLLTEGPQRFKRGRRSSKSRRTW